MYNTDSNSFLPSLATRSKAVLLCGKEGTGRKHLAKKLHTMSSRRNRPFITVDCKRVSDPYANDTGHDAGSANQIPEFLSLPTGERPGTVFFDEVGKLSPAFQRVILQMLELRPGKPPGNGTGRDLAIIASTSRDLQKLARTGYFRHDLYCGLNTVRIDLQPLCLRKSELERIAEGIIRRLNKKYNRSTNAINAFTPDAMVCLLAYDWPGNITELVRTLEYCFMVCNCSVIGVEHLPDHIFDAGEEGCALPLTSMEMIRYYIIASALKRHARNYGAVAREVGMSKKALLRTMRDWELE